jgi:two-component system NtrC family response regulator
MPTGMKPVKCAVDDGTRRKAADLRPQPMGNFPEAPEISARHVLVIDDEPLIRWSVVESLSDLGLDVEEAPDATTALRMVTTAARPFDVVLLDLRLPDMHDLSLLATLRQLLPAAALILMTAFGTPEIFADAEALGAAVLNKPFEIDDLKKLIHG